MTEKSSLQELFIEVITYPTKTQGKFQDKRYFFDEVAPLRAVRKCVDEIFSLLNFSKNFDDVFTKVIIIITCLKYFWSDCYDAIIKEHSYFKVLTKEIESLLDEDERRNDFEFLTYRIAGILNGDLPQSDKDYTDKYQNDIFFSIDLLERLGWQLDSYQYFNLAQGYHLLGISHVNVSDFLYVDYNKFYKSYVNHKIQCAIDYYCDSSKPIFTDEQKAVDLLFSEVLQYSKSEWDERYKVYSENYFRGEYYKKYFNNTISIIGISSAITIARAMHVCNVSVDRWKKFLEMLFETDILRNRDSFNFTLIAVLCPVVVSFAKPGKSAETKNRRSVFVYMLQQFNKLVKGIQHKQNLNKSIVYWQFIFYSLEYIGYEYIRSGIVSFNEVEVMKILNDGNKERISSEIDDLKKKVRFVLAALDAKYVDNKIANVEDAKEFIRLNFEIIESTIEMDLEITRITSETKSYGSVFDELITSGKSKDKILEEAREKIEMGEWHPWYYAEIEMELKRRNIQ